MNINFGHAKLVSVRGTVADLYKQALDHCIANRLTRSFVEWASRWGAESFSTSMLMREFLRFTARHPSTRARAKTMRGLRT